MIEEFDKEIDALLRQAARGETAFAANNPQSAIRNPHLDADEISLFAENALPQKSRENAVAHFADCDRCRKILSDLIVLSSENEVVAVKEEAKIAAPSFPWYRKLFVFPNVAYTMGALALVFSGIVAFTILQSVDNSKNPEVSQISERPAGGAKGMSSDGESVSVEKENSQTSVSNMSSSSAMSNAAMSNSAVVSSSNSMMSNAVRSSIARSSNANSTSDVTTATTNKPIVSANESPKAERYSEDGVTEREISELPVNGRNFQNLPEEKNKRAQDKKEGKNDATTTDTTKSSAPPTEADRAVAGAQSRTEPDAPSPKSAPPADSKLSAERRSARKKSQPAAETKQIGGKTFERQNNVWIDSAYKNQSTISVSRGTSEFKKLDSGLRSIAENLGGTVIIVWKDKAYRIQ